MAINGAAYSTHQSYYDAIAVPVAGEFQPVFVAPVVAVLPFVAEPPVLDEVFPGAHAVAVVVVPSDYSIVASRSGQKREEKG